MNGLLMNISTAIVFLSLGAGVASLITHKTLWRWVLVAVVILLALAIPILDSNPWLWANGAVGELSITSLILLTSFTTQKLVRVSLLSVTTRRHLYFLILLTGILLFPATLGLVQFDPYVFGYSFELSLLLLSLAVLYWIQGKHQISIIILVVVSASVVGLSTSINTWDYFIDPLLWLFSPMLLVMLIKKKKEANIFS